MSGVNEYFAGGLKQRLQAFVPLGTGAVATQTRGLVLIRRNSLIKSIRFHGNAAVTGTTLTAEIFARTLAGAAGNTLQASATDIAFASTAAARTGVAAALTATIANRALLEHQLLEVVFTATAITAGPGDLLCVVEYEPRQ